ncbi:MAG: calcium-translocating P-type ATPase, PMCA-type [Candidatus Lokiarchaeota archaeon]|nr:calcium-translocating P-type ATPase, PMCA-type [Candidatus Lokiarchaeota archaeon]
MISEESNEESQKKEEEKYFTKSIDEALDKLETDRKGLTSDEADRRFEKYGPNELASKPPKPRWKLFLEQFNDPLVIILIIAAVISLVVEFIEEHPDPTDAIVITLIVLANAIIGFKQEGKASDAIAKLREAAAPKAEVYRDGKEVQLFSREIVPGDIIELNEGDNVPADGRLIEAVNLKIDEASLTGESVAVNKNTKTIEDEETPLAERDNMCFMGCLTTYGRGKAVVTRTGMDTEFGKIAQLISDVEEKQTPLQEKIGQFGKWLGYLILLVCVIVFIAELGRGENPLEMFIVAISLAVAAIPEGLPAVVTTCLAIGVTRMTKKNAIIKKLPSVETLGCTDVICTDKTGTLTKNEMTVKKLYVDHETYNVSGTGYEPTGEFAQNDQTLDINQVPTAMEILRIGLLCNNAKLAEDKKKGYIIFGDPTEGCLIVSALKAGLTVERLEEEYPRVYELPFDSVRKKMSVICKHNGKYYSYIKGAAEIILDDCPKIMIDGQVRDLTQDDKNKIMNAYNEMASNALRGLGFAYKELSSYEEGKEYTVEELERELVFVGLQTMIDPPREETKPSIALCNLAGITVKMITGDNLITAKAIATELGITTEDGKAYEGKDVDNLTPEEIEECNVFARVSPEHKQKIVNALQEEKHITAMTGDGVNDAPALKMADVGVAMGITGTDVSKEAADMILADDQFNTIVTAVEEGRGIYDNIKKFIMYLLSSNIAEILIMFVAIIINFETPLVATQILWINLVTDGLPGVALSVDPYDPTLMKRKPRDSEEPIITKRFASTMVIRGAIITLFILILFWLYDQGPLAAKTLSEANFPNWFDGWLNSNPEYLEHPDPDAFKLLWYNHWRARSVLFNCLVIGELINAYNSRSEYASLIELGIFTNMSLFYSVLISFALTIFIFYLPPAAGIFYLLPQDGLQWLLAFVFATPVFFTVEFLKIFYRKQEGLDFHLNPV